MHERSGARRPAEAGRAAAGRHSARSPRTRRPEVQELQQQLQQEFQRRIEPIIEAGRQGEGPALHLQRPRLRPGLGRRRARHPAEVIKKLDAAKAGAAGRAQATRPVDGQPRTARPPVTVDRVACPPRASRVSIVPLLERQRFRLPAVLVDAVAEHEPGRRSSPSRTSPSTKSSSRATSRARRCCPAC